MEKIRTAIEILEDLGINPKDYPKLHMAKLVEAMEEYSEQNCTTIQELFNKPAEVLKPLESIYREAYPDIRGRFYTPDRTKFYTWIRNTVLGI